MQTSYKLPAQPPPHASELLSLVSDIQHSAPAITAQAHTECPPHMFDRAGYCTLCGTLIEDQ